MNQRITELMLEAGRTIPGDKHIDADFCEKFAELIVAECLQYLRDEAERLYTLEDEDADMLAEKCYDNIQGLKDHFGVEP